MLGPSRQQIHPGAGGGGVSHTDDTAFGIATDQVTPIGALADEAAPDSVDEGDVGLVRLALNRVLYTMILDAAGNERGATVGADFGLDTDTLMLPAAAWTTLVDDIRIDDDPTSYNSAGLDVSEHNACWILIDIDSTLAATTFLLSLRYYF